MSRPIDSPRSTAGRGESSGKRIETQIPRRKQGKKAFPLESEWEIESGRPPSQLRMPQKNMKKGSGPNS
jgi:hypothetical protein